MCSCQKCANLSLLHYFSVKKLTKKFVGIFESYIFAVPNDESKYLDSMKKFFLFTLSLIPLFAGARNLNQSVEPDSVPQVYEYNIVIDTIETMIIRPDDAQIEYLYQEQTKEEAQHLAKTQPKEEPKKKKKSSVTITNNRRGYSQVFLVDTQHGSGRGYEVRLSGGLSKGIGEFVDTNANLKVAGVYNRNFNWGFGIESGFYYSATPYGTSFVPVLGLVDYYFDSLNGFVPYFEFYGGSLIGVKQDIIRKGDNKLPNCGLIGGKVGIGYTFKGKVTLRVAVDYFHLMENSSKNYGNTSVSCLGPSGSICYVINK